MLHPPPLGRLGRFEARSAVAALVAFALQSLHSAWGGRRWKSQRARLPRPAAPAWVGRGLPGMLSPVVRSFPGTSTRLNRLASFTFRTGRERSVFCALVFSQRLSSRTSFPRALHTRTRRKRCAIVVAFTRIDAPPDQSEEPAPKPVAALFRPDPLLCCATTTRIRFIAVLCFSLSLHASLRLHVTMPCQSPPSSQLSLPPYPFSPFFPSQPRRCRGRTKPSVIRSGALSSRSCLRLPIFPCPGCASTARVQTDPA